MRKILVIADWAGDALACQEFRSTVEGYALEAKHAHIFFIPSSRSTVDAGFLAVQIAHTEERYGSPSETVIYIDVQDATAPEKPSPDECIVAKLCTGLYLCGPLRGLTYTFVRRFVEVFWTYADLPMTPLALPYRDIYARVVTHLADYMEDQLDLDELHTSKIPLLPTDVHYVLRADHVATVTISLTQEEVRARHREGEQVVISLGGKEYSFTFTPHPLSYIRHPWHLYPSSSGDIHNPYMNCVGLPESPFAVFPGAQVTLH